MGEQHIQGIIYKEEFSSTHYDKNTLNKKNYKIFC